MGLEFADEVGTDELRNICKLASCSTEHERVVAPRWYAEMHDWINKSKNQETREYLLNHFQKKLFQRREGDYLVAYRPLITVLVNAGVTIPEPSPPAKKRSKSKSKASHSAKRSKSNSPKRKPIVPVLTEEEVRPSSPKKSPPSPQKVRRPVDPDAHYVWNIRVHYVALHSILLKVMPELTSRWENFHCAVTVGKMDLVEFRQFIKDQFELVVDLSIPSHWLLSGFYSNISLLDATAAGWVERNMDELYREISPKIDIIRDVCREAIQARGKPVPLQIPRSPEMYLALVGNGVRSAIRELGDQPEGVKQILDRVLGILEKGESHPADDKAQHSEVQSVEESAHIDAPEVPTPLPPKITLSLPKSRNPKKDSSSSEGIGFGSENSSSE